MWEFLAVFVLAPLAVFGGIALLVVGLYGVAYICNLFGGRKRR